MNVTTIIVNYQTAALTIDCLQSLEAVVVSTPNFKVELIDGGSGDDSADRLSEAIRENGWDSWVNFSPLKENLGFAGANNVGIRNTLLSESPPDAIWLLNPDTVVHADSLAPLLEVLKNDSSIGIVGSRLQWPDGEPQCSACRFPTVRSEFVESMRLGLTSWMFASHEIAPQPSSISGRVHWVAGASFLVRSEVFEKIGLLDDGYFMYFEEVDFCRRAADAGYSSWYEPTSRVVHLVGQASGVTGEQQVLNRRPTYWFDSRRRYFLKHLGWWHTAMADIIWLAGRATWIARSFIQRKPPEDPPRLWRDFLRNSILVRRIDASERSLI